MDRREFLTAALAPGAFAGSLARVASGQAQAEPQSSWYDKPAEPRAGFKDEFFEVDVRHRVYDKHRQGGCTVLTFRVKPWPGNEFGLWLPETVYVDGKIRWNNWSNPERLQSWKSDGTRVEWRKEFEDFTVTSTLRSDPANRCLWYKHTFKNTSAAALRGLSSQTCFHMVNAPEFISPGADRIWARLDDQWTSTDKVPRHESPDPRRVLFLKRGLRAERTILRESGFPSATMGEQACHPLFMVENIRKTGVVGIASRNFKHLFNNNDSILRCLHSEPLPIESLPPGESASQEAVCFFHEGDRAGLLAHFDKVVPPAWPEERR